MRITGPMATCSIGMSCSSVTASLPRRVSPGLACRLVSMSSGALRCSIVARRQREHSIEAVGRQRAHRAHRDDHDRPTGGVGQSPLVEFAANAMQVRATWRLSRGGQTALRRPSAARDAAPAASGSADDHDNEADRANATRLLTAFSTYPTCRLDLQAVVAVGWMARRHGVRRRR